MTDGQRLSHGVGDHLLGAAGANAGGDIGEPLRHFAIRRFSQVKAAQVAGAAGRRDKYGRERSRKSSRGGARPQRRKDSDQIIVSGRGLAFAETDQRADDALRRARVASSYGLAQLVEFRAGDMGKLPTAAVVCQRQPDGPIRSRNRDAAAIEIERGDAAALLRCPPQVDAKRTIGKPDDASALGALGIRGE